MSDYTDYMAEPKAPLAEADLSELQGLTLEDLARLHGDSVEDTPVTMEMSEQSEEPIESDVALELQAHAGNMPAWVDEVPAPDKQLRQALVLSLGNEEVHLDQKDDLRRITHQAGELFQDTLPGAMQRLSQFLHAREQSDHLYDRLAELSSKRGAAVEIIQTAKQIENLEKVLESEKLYGDELYKLEAELEQFEQVIGRYREIFRLAQQLL
ncbi:MAG TPA: hypothetical protein V6D23_21120 [Candidatus Obscuribacterales bacterium]